MSDGIAGRIDEMGTRIDELDKSITQVGALEITRIGAVGGCALCVAKRAALGIRGTLIWTLHPQCRASPLCGWCEHTSLAHVLSLCRVQLIDQTGMDAPSSPERKLAQQRSQNRS